MLSLVATSLVALADAAPIAPVTPALTFEPAPILIDSPNAPVDWSEFAPVAGAVVQDAVQPTGGVQLFSFGGDLRNTDYGDFEVDTLLLRTAGGYFLDEHHEVGGAITLIRFDFDGGDATIWDLSPYYNYNVALQPRLWAYGGAHLGLTMVDASGADDTAIAYGLHAGARYWVTPRAAFYAEPGFTLTEIENEDVTDIYILFGFTVLL
jgi:hypothetical protein